MPLILFLYIVGIIIVYKLADHLKLNRRFWTLLAVLASTLVATLIIMFVWLVKLFKPKPASKNQNKNDKDNDKDNDSDFDDKY